MMAEFGIINFPAFLLAGILLNLTPGSDTMFILARSISLGKKAGILSALGISTGAVVHTLAAAFGLSVILANSATAFLLVKYAGACYLIYLGVRSFTARSMLTIPQEHIKNSINYREIYVSGMLTNILNPKVALFFLAFLPQFIITGIEHSMVSFLILGAAFIFTGTIWCLCLALFASLLAGKLTKRGSFIGFLHKVTGGIFIGLGVKLALSPHLS
jgi:threonine/homoserine/homoserine lactone efflux protein